MLLAELVDTHAAVAATRSRLRKRELLAAALRSAAGEGDVPPEQRGTQIEVVASYLSGRARQRRTGVGWRSLADPPAAAREPSLTPVQVDDALETMAGLQGPGSQAARAAALTALYSRATPDEQRFLTGLVLGELRQGALDSLLLDAIAAAADVPLTSVRRAAMFSALSGPIARAALTGGAPALESFGLRVGRPVRPMLASSAPDVGGALERFDGVEVAADVKLDGIRVQVHRSGDDVSVFTRSLDDITERLPEVVALARSLDVESAVLDGEAIALDETGRPRAFQDTAARTGSHDAESHQGRTPLTVFFFDILHLDGSDLIDAPAAERLVALDIAAPPSAVVPRVVSADPDAVQGFFDDTVAAGHEGLVLKSLDAPYDAGRRGSAWVKVKPRHTLDLVVLAVERGSGRREGWLSNIHLGARDPATGGFVMLGKTFKGMTDETLAWQTERFIELADGPTDGSVVRVRPEQVVEIAFDGVQRSPRYPGGVALRFARVVRYRDDKTAEEADTIDQVRTVGSV
ncbi:DNA ligase-1 [Isoptericola sp. CG 20/1183]|uniref:Probable DNA ligase n=1 Tax=Isoptericola halotolerans TaxID=300560 RepID=A0ABX5EE03_9MICO|nr:MULTISPECIES: ATP-dependent DNA ligase [Isoptericola]PRZ06470.1 DNA ligase-1 [Isoptericola halotolerans]PRZ06724.1 DNA ligase-1 [Isoptericola sp. CG 20/1183]